ncbi:hypothetical protein [Pseudomonas sp. ANT_J28]|uniref:hypothetical protein n=1 Tax=Pseudomonas sp. ANT_J28 TaxID=2597352 RepID=UPI0011F0DE90|nr:hypothetical protein [Pseudomonas sp. ANT_J28]KAA0985675.1 hypothetical protein FQ187_04205 [Pseudomonas sp. ANT_J28]
MNSKRPILIMVFLHEDLKGYDKDSIYDDYFSWLKTELENISSRNVSIILSTESNTPEMYRYRYKNENSDESVNGWNRMVDNLIAKVADTYPYDPNLTKFLLLTRDPINSTTGGMAPQPGRAGIASILSYRFPAHEVGHMLNAAHEDSEIIYDGWWHDTIMKVDIGSSFRGNAYHFSEKNRA